MAMDALATVEELAVKIARVGTTMSDPPLTARRVRGRFDRNFSDAAKAVIVAAVAHLDRHQGDAFPRAEGHVNVYMALRRQGVICWDHASREMVDGKLTCVHFYHFTDKAMGLM